jgi:restriction endonuclease S subunit
MSNFAALADVCELITDGTHYTPRNVGQGFPFVTVKDMSPSGIDLENCSRISESDFSVARKGNSVPIPGDVLFSKDGTVGKVYVVGPDDAFAVLSSIAILRPDGRSADSRYLAHCLRIPQILDKASGRKTGSAVRRIILKDIKKLSIPLPSLTEQRRMAEILDSADELRRKHQVAMTECEALISALQQLAFTGEL